MRGILNHSKLRFVLFHLFHHFDIDSPYQIIVHEKRQELHINIDGLLVIFHLSPQDLELNKVKWIDGIPVLFPISRNQTFYTEDNKKLIFTDDLLKSAFYLLSGIQEYNSIDHDHYDRFPYESSIQYKLGIIHQPVVNYYFEVITKAIEDKAQKAGIAFKRKQLSNSFVFLLTHDIDIINAYDINETGYKIKQFLGLSKRPYSKGKSFKVMLKHIAGFFFLPIVGNPYWTFPYLHKIASRYNLKSIYFFLEKDQRHSDSYYKFTDRRILRIMRKLKNKGYEIALHATRRSANDEKAFLSTYANLQNVYPDPIDGVRQHTLRYFAPYTARFWHKAGIKYDSTLGFAAHEGFRNSYCHPFKVYDFEKEEMLNVWEFPLNIMDVTLFGYRRLNYDDALKSTAKIISEIQRFNGVLTLLWHNNMFDEDRYPGIKSFYNTLISQISGKAPESITGRELTERLYQSTYPHVNVKND